MSLSTDIPHITHFQLLRTQAQTGEKKHEMIPLSDNFYHVHQTNHMANVRHLDAIAPQPTAFIFFLKV